MTIKDDFVIICPSLEQFQNLAWSIKDAPRKQGESLKKLDTLRVQCLEAVDKFQNVIGTGLSDEITKTYQEVQLAVERAAQQQNQKLISSKSSSLLATNSATHAHFSREPLIRSGEGAIGKMKDCLLKLETLSGDSASILKQIEDLEKDYNQSKNQYFKEFANHEFLNIFGEIFNLKAVEIHKQFTSKVAALKKTHSTPKESLLTPLPPLSTAEVKLIITSLFPMIEARIQTEGIYRVSGIDAHRKSVVEQFRRNPRAIVEIPQDVHTITGILKALLRENMNHKLLQSQVENFRKAESEKNIEEKNKILRGAIQSLPDGERAVLKLSLNHLNAVAQASGTNCMKSSNLAIIFGPIFFDVVKLEDAGTLNSITQYLIDHPELCQ